MYVYLPFVYINLIWSVNPDLTMGPQIHYLDSELTKDMEKPLKSKLTN